eukprot:gene3952-4921_t
MANNSLRDSLLANAPVEPVQSNFLYSAEMLEDLDGGAPIAPLATALGGHLRFTEESLLTLSGPDSDVADALPQDWPRTGADEKTLLLFDSLESDTACCGGSQATADLKEHVFREAQRMSALTTTNRREMQGFMSNEELLRGLTFYWERPQAIFLDYDRLSIYSVDKDGVTQPQENDYLPAGRLLLTDKRLLFLSNQRDKKSLLSEHESKSGRSSTQFTVQSHDRETQLYYPIPLSKVQSINFRLHAGSESRTEISAEDCCLTGCFPCCFPRHWKLRKGGLKNVNRRVISMGVYLPPWDGRCEIRIQVNPSVQIQ